MGSGDAKNQHWHPVFQLLVTSSLGHALVIRARCLIFRIGHAGEVIVQGLTDLWAQVNVDGVAGLKKIGVKDLSYRMVFIANSVHTGDSRFGFTNPNVDNLNDNEDADQDEIRNQFTLAERDKVCEMKNESNLYTKLANSIAPSVHGHLDVKKGILLQLFGGI